MNSLNIISARVSPPSSAAPSRSNSLATLGLAVTSSDQREDPAHARPSDFPEQELTTEPDDFDANTSLSQQADEKSPLLSGDSKDHGTRSSPWHRIPHRIASTLINSIRWVLSTLAAPGVYLIACLYNADGEFVPIVQLRRLFGARKAPEPYQNPSNVSSGLPDVARDGLLSRGNSDMVSERPMSSSSSAFTSESESDQPEKLRGSSRSSSSRHSKTRSTEEIAPARRSIRIKLHSDDAVRQKKTRKAQSSPDTAAEAATGDIAAQLKSPTSPAGALTKYPKNPAPPRPLIPRRQPSYISAEPSADRHRKTLILDLDETLIHSMSKGGRMGTGHMVEVRLNTTYVGVAGQAAIGPQHPILYYVYKRPHCDDFLRRVCKWFNLVIFTASVQEYADPVIDWLESERKFFTGRFYRQHCTFRHGAFIKDLSFVEPDLSKVMILDNSPLSYLFHQDNAIPIQGWINDPTDNDLLNLVPFLEGMQYVSDVRALLALRAGEDGQHMA